MDAVSIFVVVTLFTFQLQFEYKKRTLQFGRGILHIILNVPTPHEKCHKLRRRQEKERIDTHGDAVLPSSTSKKLTNISNTSSTILLLFCHCLTGVPTSFLPRMKESYVIISLKAYTIIIWLIHLI